MKRALKPRYAKNMLGFSDFDHDCSVTFYDQDNVQIYVHLMLERFTYVKSIFFNYT